MYLLFGALTRESRSADAYLDEVRAGSGNRRWQAAFELSRILEAGEAKTDEETAKKAVDLFRAAKSTPEDPRVRRYLALALGRLRDPLAVRDLADALGDPDGETRIYSAIALGAIGDRSATPSLVGALADDDAGVRKAAAYSLGALADPSAAQALRERLHDPAVDVTWNAAVALARIGDPSGAEVLRSMADRAFVERASQSEDPALRAEVIVAGIGALALLRDRESEPVLRQLAAEDPDLKVRDAAHRALQVLAGTGPAS